MIKVSPIQTLLSNQYLLQSAQGSLLIDTGLELFAKRLISQLNSLCSSENLLSMIVITHADGDHCGALSAIQDREYFAGITAATSRIEADAIEKGQMSRELHPGPLLMPFYGLAGKLFSKRMARIDCLLENGTFLTQFDLEVLHTPGHTPGHISLWCEEAGFLFCGDSILIHGKRLLPSADANTWNEGLAEESYVKQIALKPEIIYGGHGIWKKNHYL